MRKLIKSGIALLLVRNTVQTKKTVAALITLKTASRFSFVASLAVFVVGPMLVQPDPEILKEHKQSESFEPVFADYKAQAEKVCGGTVISTRKQDAWYDQMVVLDQRGRIKLKGALKVRQNLDDGGVWPIAYCAEKPSETCWTGQQKALAYYPGGVIYDNKKYGAEMADKALKALFANGKNGVDPKKVNAFCI